MKKVTVFCASSTNCDEFYLLQARQLGELLAQSGKEIIYGGGNIGLMGELADGALSINGIVKGVIPTFLQELELGHKGLSELIEVNSLHQRESIMLLEADVIIALPGGIGTFSELLQAITWKRLWRIKSKIIIVNINHYFDPLIEMLNKATKEKFLNEKFKTLWIVVDSVEEAVLTIDKN